MHMMLSTISFRFSEWCPPIVLQKNKLNIYTKNPNSSEQQKHELNQFSDMSWTIRRFRQFISEPIFCCCEL